MKKLYKRILAAVLCLTLMAAIVPATVFAEDVPDDQWIKDEHFWPGQLHLTLKGIFTGDLTKLFPELDIEKYELRGRFPVTDEELSNPHYFGMQSSTYYVELREKTREAVLNAIALLKDNQYLFAARPVRGGIVPGEVNVLLKEQYYTYQGPDGGPYPDLRDILPEIEIESYRDLCLSVINVRERPIEEHSSIIVAHVGTEFAIRLTEKTEEASMRAAELLKDNPYVKGASPNQYLYIADDVEDNSTGLSVGDALRVLRVAANLVEADPEIAAAFYDKDGDGAVTVGDALLVLRIAAGLA